MTLTPENTSLPNFKEMNATDLTAFFIANTKHELSSASKKALTRMQMKPKYKRNIEYAEDTFKSLVSELTQLIINAPSATISIKAEELEA